MISNLQFVNEARDVRLDVAVLLHCPTSTRAFVREAINAGAVAVAARPGGELKKAAKGLKLRGGEMILVRALAEAADNLVKPAGDCPAPVFEDAALLAFDKPAGIPVQPLAHDEVGTLMNAVVTRYPECLPLGDRPLMAGALHRIDAGTSGLVLVARSAAAFSALRAQFSEHRVEKTYLALVEGNVAVGGTLEHELVHDPSLPYCRMVDARHARFALDGRRIMKAITNFRPVAHTTVENEERTLLEVKIFTGVTHQIRAQLALAGMHIINDRLYGAFAVEDQVGHCLHALAAKFQHPVSGVDTEIRTPHPVWARDIR